MYSFYSNIKTIQQFLNTTDANWRNSLYIECCHCKLNCVHSQDFLYAPGPDGTPIIVPVCDVEFLFGRRLDKTECLSEFSIHKFADLYSEWLQRQIQEPDSCHLMQAVKAMNAPEEW